MTTLVTKRYEWDMAHRLPLHDGKCRRLHGHRYVVEIDFSGQIFIDGPSTGMVIDFSKVKTMLDLLIGDEWDHRCMVHKDDDLLIGLQADRVEDFVVVDWMPTAENIARELFRLLRDTWNVTRVRVYETPSGWAEVTK